MARANMVLPTGFLFLAGLSVLLLTACGPVSPEAAARVCEERARAALGPTGEVYLGVSNRGPAYGGEISISSDAILGRDPYDVYDECVRDKTGQGPIRPLNLG